MAIKDISLYQRSDNGKMQLKVGEASARTDFGYSVNTFDLTPEQFSQLKGLGISVEDAGTTTWQPTQGGQSGSLDTASLLKQLQGYASSYPKYYLNAEERKSKLMSAGTLQSFLDTEQQVKSGQDRFSNIDISKLPTTGGYLYEPNKGQEMPQFRDRGASEDMGSYLKAKQAFEIQNTGKSGISFGTAGVPTNTLASQGTAGTTTPTTTSYTIKSGDTLSALAQKNGTTVQAIMALNPQITDPNKIYAGQSLKLSGANTPTPILNTGNNAIATSDQSINAENIAKADKEKASQEQIASVQKELTLKQAQSQLQKYNEALGLAAPIVPKAPEAPAVVNMQTTEEALKSKNGVADLEAQQNKLKADQRVLDDEYLLGTQKVGNKLEPMELISAENQELQRQYQEKKYTIDRNLARVQDELTTKYNVIEHIMANTKTDYANAVNAYNTAFSQNLQTQQLLEGQQSTAKANLTLILNSLKDKDISWNDIDTSLRNELVSLGLKSGFSMAQTEAMFSNLGTGEKQVSATLVESASGDYYSILTRKADGTYSTSTMPTGKSTPVKGTAGDIADEKDKTENTMILNELNNYGKRTGGKTENSVSLGYFNQVKASQNIYNSDEFDKKFKYLLSTEDQVKIKGTNSASDLFNNL